MKAPLIPFAEKLGYSTGEVAALLSCSEKTIRRLIKEKKLHAIRIGERRLLVPRSAILKMLNSAQKFLIAYLAVRC